VKPTPGRRSEAASGSGRLLVLVSAALFSLSGIGIKACGFGAWQAAGVRAGVAAVALWLFLPETRRFWSWKLVPVSLSIAALHLCYVWSTKTTTAANTIFIQSSAPLWVLLASPLVLGERIRPRDLLTILVSGAGLALFFLKPETATALSPDIARGNLIALAAGVFWAGSILGLRHLRNRGAEAALLLGNLVTCATGLGFMAALPGEFHAGPAEDWIIVGLLGVVQTAAGYAFMIRGLRTVPATQGALLGLLEPVLNPIWVWLVFRTEHPGPYALVGGVLVLSGVLMETFGSEKTRGKQGKERGMNRERTGK